MGEEELAQFAYSAGMTRINEAMELVKKLQGMSYIHNVIRIVEVNDTWHIAQVDEPGYFLPICADINDYKDQIPIDAHGINQFDQHIGQYLKSGECDECRGLLSQHLLNKYPIDTRFVLDLS